MMNEQAVRCLLIPLADIQLLLPGTLIAEVLPYREPDALIENAPDWLLGSLRWRGNDVPLLDLDNLLELEHPEEDDEELPDYRIIITYGLINNEKLPFYAFIADGMPRTISVTADTLGTVRPHENAALHGEIAVVEQDAHLLDVDYVQQLLLDSGALA